MQTTDVDLYHYHHHHDPDLFQTKVHNIVTEHDSYIKQYEQMAEVS